MLRAPVEPKLIISERFGVGESPVWDAANGRLLWCDIPAGEIHALSIASSKRSKWRFDQPVASFGLAADGRFVVALKSDVVLFDPISGGIERVAHITLPRPDMRLNDGKVGPDGSFWVGSMDASGEVPAKGALYRVTPDGTVETIATGIAISNGLAWNADATVMFHSDSRGDMWLDRWDFDVTAGLVSNRRRLREHDLTSGRADGGACDVGGHYWSAGPSESRINCFTEDGKFLYAIPVPLKNPTMPCFGGKDMRTLFVTSLDSRSAEAGQDGIFTMRMPFAGVPVGQFGDRLQR